MTKAVDTNRRRVLKSAIAATLAAKIPSLAATLAAMIPIRTATLAAKFRVGAVALAAALPLAAAAQGAATPPPYPTKPVRIVCAHAPGGAADQLARIVADRLGPLLGQTVFVENKPGASTMLAAQTVAASPHDGYTLLMATVTTLSINPSMYPKIRYDPVKDFAPISVVASTPFFFGVGSTQPITNVREAIARAKERPGTMHFGSSGIGTSGHLAGELFASVAGLQLVHIPYKATSTRNTDLAGDVIQFVFGNDLMPLARAGRVRILGVTSATRLSGYPDIPTVAEAGALPGYEASVWYGLVAPAGTPAAIVNKLSAAVREALAPPDVRRAVMDTLGGDVVASTPEAFQKLIVDDLVKWRKVIERANVKPEE